jgi:WD40 repeat protein/tRNA A-37 threonylcarbamoyl transferase component Bud32
MGVVFKARQKKLNRLVAIKMILSGDLASKEAVSRFFAEAQAAATLDHPGIVPVYEIGQHDGQHYFSMGFIEGHSLAERVAKGPLPPKDAAEITRKIGEAIAYAHDKGVIHRDLKPANVLMDANGEPKVTDFGLARIQDQNSGITRTGAVMGTPSYMPPEQAAGKTAEVGPLSDVYSLGALLYCLLTGRPPFQAATPLDTLMQVIDKEPVSVQSLNSGVPKDLETICQKCLQKDSSKRYASAQAFADDLGRWIRGEPIQARAVSSSERAIRWVKRNKLVSALVAGTIAAVLIGTSASLWFGIAAKASESKAKQSEAKALEAEVIAKESEAGAKASEAKTISALARSNYFLSLARWDANRITEAKELLGRIPPELRNLEWELAEKEFEGDSILVKQMKGLVNTIAFNADCSKFLTSEYPASIDGKELSSLKVWDTANGKLISKAEAHKFGVMSTTFSPDGTSFISAGQDGITIWNTINGSPIKTLEGHANGTWSVAYSPDGNRFASAGGDGTIKLWNTANGEELCNIKAHEGIVFSIAFSPDGSRIASGSGNTESNVKVWDANSFKLIKTLDGHGEQVTNVGFSPNGSLIVSCSSDGSIKLWDETSGKEVKSLREHADVVYKAAFSPDGNRLLTGGKDRIAILWDIKSGKIFKKFKGIEFSVLGLAFSLDGSRFMTGACDDRLAAEIKQWGINGNNEFNQLIREQATINSIAFSMDGKRIVSVNEDNAIWIWDANDSDESTILNGHEGNILGVAINRDGSRIVSAGSDNTVVLWDSVSGSELTRLNGLENGISSVALSPEGSRLLIGGGTLIKGELKYWDLGNIEDPVSNIELEGIVLTTCFSPDGKRFVTGGGNFSVGGELKIWDAIGGKEILQLKGQNAPATCATFNSDGTRIASGCFDGSVMIWDASSGQLIQTLQGHQKGVSGVAFSADGTRIVTCSKDQTFKIWDAKDGQELLSSKKFSGPLQSLAMSPDGYPIIAITEGKKIVFWAGVLHSDNRYTTHKQFQSIDSEWHMECLKEAERDGNAYAAMFHRACLTKLFPNDALLQKQFKESYFEFTSNTENQKTPLPLMIQQVLGEQSP